MIENDSCIKNNIKCKYIQRGRFEKPCKKCREDWYDKGKSTHYKKKRFKR